ncbi:MAG: YdeI/OmpD-associated family protein [Bacteroidota bacterium]
MDIGQTLYVKDRRQFRSWLKKHHRSEKEIWLVYYKKNSGKPRIPYNDAVEEALCFGWIDSILKPIDHVCYAQRFSPRKPGSKLSPMNRERVRRLIRSGRMTKAGLDAIRHHVREPAKPAKLIIPPDILRALKKDRKVWENFCKFPESYKRIRVGWIAGARHRPEIFKQRLNYFLKMTGQGKRFGMVQ